MKRLAIAALCAFLLVGAAGGALSPSLLKALNATLSAQSRTGIDSRQKTYNQEVYNALQSLDQRVTALEHPAPPPPPGPPPPPAPPPPPPPPMPQGSNLPTRHTQNITRQYWVDAVAGSDATSEATARDNSGAPWQTLQKVITSGVAPATGDIAVNIVNSAPYQASGAATLSTAGGPASSSHWIIWRAAQAARPVIKMSSGTTGTQHDAIKLGTGFNVLKSLEITSDGASGPSSGGSDGEGVWVNSANNELEDLYIHDFKLASNTSAKVQAVFDDGGDNLQVWGIKIRDIGRPGGAIPGQEHGFYLNSCTNVYIINSLIYDINNGWPAQSYPSGAGNHNHYITQATWAFESSTSASGGQYIYSRAINNLELHNSIFFDGGSGKFSIDNVDSNTGTGRVIDHLIVKNVHGAGDFANETDWTETNVLKNTDPLFVNGPGRDLRLQSGSPAIGYTDTTWSPPTDINGTPRSPGSEDAGAIEYTATGGVWFVP